MFRTFLSIILASSLFVFTLMTLPSYLFVDSLEQANFFEKFQAAKESLTGGQGLGELLSADLGNGQTLQDLLGEDFSSGMPDISDFNFEIISSSLGLFKKLLIATFAFVVLMYFLIWFFRYREDKRKPFQWVFGVMGFAYLTLAVLTYLAKTHLSADLIVNWFESQEMFEVITTGFVNFTEMIAGIWTNYLRQLFKFSAAAFVVCVSVFIFANFARNER